MIKKIIAMLTRDSQQRMDISHLRHESEQKEKNKIEAELAKGRHDQIMRDRDRKYVSETTIPEGEVRRPDDSASEKAGE